MRDYRNIKAYQLSDDMVVEVYRLTKDFPREELYGLTSQLRRASLSVPTNIVEGASRNHKRDYLHFLYISRGSMSETQYLLHLAKRLNYLDESNYESLNHLTEESARTLYGLIVSVEKETKFPVKLMALITSSIALYGLKFLKGF